jgi:hypothetical protein
VKHVTIVLVALLLGLAVPTLAGAQLGPTNIPAPLTQTDPSDSEAVPIEEDQGISTLQLVLIFGAAIAVIGLIASVIMRDAHRAAPGPERSRTAGATGAAGGTSASKSAREREREKARKRNKAKAARNQRKRNRPR